MGCIQGHAGAQFNIGTCYKNGNGVERSAAQVIAAAYYGGKSLIDGCSWLVIP